MDVIDEINGVRETVVTRPDGTKELRRTAMPLSPEQQALKEQFDRIVNTQLTSIETLSRPELAASIPEFQPALKAFREQVTAGLDRSQAQTARISEEQLARRGLSQSTAATELRNVQANEFAGQRQQAAQQETLLAEDLRNQAIGRSQNLLSIATQRQDQQALRYLQAQQSAASSQLGLLQAQQAANQLQYSAQLNAFQAQQQSRASMFNTLGTLGGVGLAYGLQGGGFGLLGRKPRDMGLGGITG
ncbi:MAG: hypothetical protein ACK5NY_03490 [Burkholderiaceae bacterium]